MYTRNLADITHRVPEIVEVVRALPVHDVILDGETLSLDADGGPRPFQDTMARFGSETDQRRPCCGRGSSTCCTWTDAT